MVVAFLSKEIMLFIITDMHCTEYSQIVYGYKNGNSNTLVGLDKQFSQHQHGNVYARNENKMKIILDNSCKIRVERNVQI